MDCHISVSLPAKTLRAAKNSVITTAMEATILGERLVLTVAE
jgi:hypothetical protein